MDLKEINKKDIFAHNFDVISLEQAVELNRYFYGYDYQGANYSFLANYIWRNDYDMGWEIIGDYLVVGSMFQREEDGRTFVGISMPMTKTGTYEKEKIAYAVNEMKRRCDLYKIPMYMYGISAHLMPLLEEALPGEMEFYHDRDMDEYVYEKQKLITLSGRALHKKKNHLNYFLKTYTYETKPLTADMEAEILALSDRVKDAKERSEDQLMSLAAEKNAIQKMVDFLERKNVFTRAIYIDGQLQAYAIGEKIGPDTVVEHFEKANLEYRGLYQAILSEFCKSLPEEILYINREEDMGLENLRQAKLALRPHHMAEKYHGNFVVKEEAKTWGF